MKQSLPPGKDAAPPAETPPLRDPQKGKQGITGGGGSCSPPPPPVSEGILRGGGRRTEGGWKPRQSPEFPGQKQQPRLFLTRGGGSPGLSLLIPPTDPLRPFWPPPSPSSPPFCPTLPAESLRRPPGCGRSSCAMGRTAQAPEQPFPEDKRLRVTGKAARRAAAHVAFGSASHNLAPFVSVNF